MSYMYGPHPAAGLGEGMPGGFQMKAQPVRDRGTALVPSVFGRFPNRTIYRPTLQQMIPYAVQPKRNNSVLGYLIAGSFTVPQNPVTAGAGLSALVPGAFTVPQNPITAASGMSGLGCATCQGMGQLPSFLEDSSGNPNWMLIGALGVGAYFLFFHHPHGKGSSASAAPSTPAAQNRRRRRNESVDMGFYDKSGRFHPIRASDDYDPGAVGEGRAYARRKKKRR